MGIDPRHHAISLIATFLALAIGILVGVSLGQQERLESRIQKLGAEFSSLRDENKTLSKSVAAMQAHLLARRDFELPYAAQLLGNQLPGTTVALVRWKDVEEVEFEKDLQETLQLAGANVLSVTTLRPDFLERSVRLASGPGSPAAVGSSEPAQQYAQAIGTSLAAANGQDYLRSLEGEGLLEMWGDYTSRPQWVVLVGFRKGPADDRGRAVDVPLLSAAIAQGAGALAAEPTVAPDTNVPIYNREQAIATVDNIDTLPGQVALVLAMRNRASGNFGIKPTRNSLLPGS